jgi:hypothetical protein
MKEYKYKRWTIGELYQMGLADRKASGKARTRAEIFGNRLPEPGKETEEEQSLELLYYKGYIAGYLKGRE